MDDRKRLCVGGPRNGKTASDAPAGCTAHTVIDSEGVVTRVVDGYIGVSVGLDDKVKEGQEFTVHRGSMYVGRIRIVRPSRDVSVATELAEWRQDPDREIKEGDSISNAI